MTTATAFRAINLPQAGPEPDLFGLWLPVPPEQPATPEPDLPGTQDFQISPEDAGPLCWRVDLAPDSRQAAAELDRALAGLDATMSCLEGAGGRLAGFAARDGLPPPSDTAYDLDTAPLARPPEADLQALLDELALAGEPAQAGEGADYDFGALSAGPIAEAVAGYQGFLRQFYQSVSVYARVETAQWGRVLARTRVGWTSDMDTAWHARVTAEQIALHERSLSLALETRAGLLRVAVLVMQGARLLAQLSVMAIATPSLILAAPAAWRFIQQVLAEARRRQQWQVPSL
jgi:hypothetical protein